VHITGRVLVCDPIDHAGISALQKAGMTVDYCPNIDGKELIYKVKDYEVIVVRSRTIISREVIDAAINAKIIARVGVGLDNIDIDAAKVKDMSVINAAEAAINAVAELVIGNMISLARNITRADAEMKKGNWIKRDLIGTELSGKYLGLIGVGNIGRNVGRIARGLRMNILGYDVIPINRDYIKEVGLIRTDLDTLVQSADFISCHVPLTFDTKHMLNAELLAKMKQTAYIINTSRGGVIDENALYQSLKANKIAGAALDVFEIEPPTNRSLIELPNVVCTPHIGSQTKESQELGSTVIAEKVIQIMYEKSNIH
jgi:D-3-phosphoglycerate dehydrogenase / 2-oxoglutarate reductase